MDTFLWEDGKVRLAGYVFVRCELNMYINFDDVTVTVNECFRYLNDLFIYIARIETTVISFHAAPYVMLFPG